MKTIAFTAIAALLGACSTPTSTPTPDSAAMNAAGEYVVVQDGATYLLQKSAAAFGFGVSFDTIRVGSSGNSTAYGFSNADVTAVGGLAGGTYITGLSGTQTSGLARAGTLNLNGLYGVNRNGTKEYGLISLTADLGAGTLIGSTPTVNVNGTIFGATVNGTFDLNGASGNLKGGFYGPAAAPTMAATIKSASMAGILVVN